jgi:hypothetical protein
MAEDYELQFVVDIIALLGKQSLSRAMRTLSEPRS